MPELHGWIFDDDLIAGESNYTPFQIYGHEGNDFLSGSNAGDLLNGGTGADSMYGWRGNDTYVVDNVDDYVEEAESHYAYGDPSDLVYASISYTLPEFVENLSLITGAGAINGTGNELENVIHGNESGNTLQGLDGDDLIIGHNGNDTLRGGNHNDELYGGNHDDTLQGGNGDDQLFGQAGYDILMGEIGNDVLDGGEEMYGATGDDTYYVYSTTTVVSEFLGDGYDEVYSTATFTLPNGVETLVLADGAGAINGTGNAIGNMIVGNDSENEIRGLDGEDFLKGGGGDDELRGGNQNDDLHGQGGDDTLRGDAGDDEMYGGIDDDDYFVNSVGDIVVEYGNEGTDAVFVSSLDNYTLTSNVENLHLTTGTNGTGNGLGNYITGNVLDNIIDGAGGADTMEGRQGDDTYRVDNAGDVVNESADQGSDTVLASVSYTLTAGSSVETLATTSDTGTAAINLTGNGINNAIRGNNGGNTLNGGGGSDGIDGRGGVDTVSYENNAWRVVVVLGVNGAPGQGYEFGLVPQEVLLSVDSLVSIENVRGSSFNDTLVGNEFVNELRGLGGSDTYVVQNAGDVIIENGGQGTDEVRAGVSYTLTAGADVETLRTTDDNGTAAINLTGNTNNNQVIGNNGGNILDGGGGNSDQLEGRGGDDTYIVNSASVTIIESGGQGSDTVRASVTYTLTTGADVETLRTNNDAGTAAINLTGNNTNNDIFGNNGSNVIAGGDGGDELTGLGGQDSFLFNSALNAASNVDEITDFNVAADTILLDDAVFTTLVPGTLIAEQFAVGAVAQEGNDRIIYNSATGALFYDADGSGAGTAIQFASLSTGLALSNLDFLVV